MKDIDLGKLRVDRNTTFSLQASVQRRLRWWHVALAVLSVGGLYAMLFAGTPEVQTTQVVVAYPSQQYVVLNSTGYVVARRKAAVASKGTGRLEWLGVSEGSTVKEGAIIARLESRDVEATLSSSVAQTAVAAAAIESAKAEEADARMNLVRVNNLYDNHYVSEIMHDDAVSRTARAQAAIVGAKASWQSAKANEDFSRNAVEYTRIRAPFDGVIISKSANVGDIVTPLSSAATSKGAVVIMADMSTLEVDADVSESSVGSIKVGQPCEITLDAFPNKRFRGEVSAIVPTVNRSSATVTTKVRFIDVIPGILPDMSARVGFLSRPINTANEQPVLAVNPDAIARRDDFDMVFKRSGDHVTAIPVVVGIMLGDVRQISGALQSGDVLVIKPPHRLHNGSAITVAEEH